MFSAILHQANLIFMKGNEWFKFDHEKFILDYFSYDWNGTLKIEEHNIER